MARPSRSFAVAVALTAACAAPRAPTPRADAGDPPDDPIACHTYRRSLDRRPRQSLLAPLGVGLAGAGVIVAATVLDPQDPPCEHSGAAPLQCLTRNLGGHLEALAVGVVGVGLLVGAAVATFAVAADDRPELASRCEEEIGRWCGDDAGGGCAAALARACDAGDPGACWALRGGPLPGSAPDSAPPAGPHATRGAPDPLPLLDAALARAAPPAAP